ncbi:decaprenyl-phosphate phosphoribosyltransferase [Dysgonomonas sp. ZJ279]|uniref:decaprenyl-phosphate phosphoribosyltransferase n=1 Tax=Dysgonomonas sp. ZJ279 TaxID=2709796 RepID=UPI0013EE18D0|nr:decaprenyl-phosphate phosphoribosyltransferase [Dysgonomonas sp. ZJ279]
MRRIKSYIQLIRVHQWVKNLFVFIPMFFAFRMTEIPLIIACIWAFIGLSFVASSIYIVNDLCDIEADKLHPMKRNRPLASGTVNKRDAFILFTFLLASGFSMYIFLLKDIYAVALLGLYFVLNVLYSFKLKHIAIVDVSIVAAGFVIRLFLGGLVTDVPLSRWVVIMTFLLALLLALGKRRDDVLIFIETGNKARKNLDGYNLDFLNTVITIMSSIIIVSYIMYTVSPEVIARNGENLYLSSIFVILGILRYLQIVFVKGDGGNPTKIFIKDRFMHIIFIGWIGTFLIFSLLYK